MPEPTDVCLQCGQSRASNIAREARLNALHDVAADIQNLLNEHVVGIPTIDFATRDAQLTGRLLDRQRRRQESAARMTRPLSP